MKQPLPIFHYHISGLSGALGSGNPLWHTPLDNRERADISSVSPAFTIGDYFKYATSFIRREDAAALKRGIAFHLHREIPLEQIEEISIFLEKHGAFYHPARVQVTVQSHASTLVFALNTAVSPPGISLMAAECRCLEKLVPSPSPDSPLPAVFGRGEMPFHDQSIAFFLAHWFQGYREFHATTPPDRGDRIMLWLSDGNTMSVPAAQQSVIYENAAEILTSFYNPATFEQIFPWHHAAGDFVAKEVNGSLNVKLITVRGYNALFDIDKIPEKRDMEDIFQGLLLFLVNLSLRMRIDRIDGTGEYYLLHKETVTATLTGFFRALGHKTIGGHTHGDLQKKFIQFLLQFDSDDFTHVLKLILNAHPHPDKERELIIKNLDSHTENLYHAIWCMGKNRFFIDKAV